MNKAVNKAIGAKLKEIRMHKGISQQELADRTSTIQRTHIVNIENGKMGITIETFLKLTKALGLDVDLVEVLDNSNWGDTGEMKKGGRKKGTTNEKETWTYANEELKVHRPDIDLDDIF